MPILCRFDVSGRTDSPDLDEGERDETEVINSTAALFQLSIASVVTGAVILRSLFASG